MLSRLLVVLGLVCLFPLQIAAEVFLHEGAPEIPSVQASPGALPQFAGLVKVISPAVVNISVEGSGEQDQKEMARPPLPFFGGEDAPVYRSLGSGFIVSPNGYIVTSNHVVEKADKVVVRLLDDKTEYRAEIVGRDQKSDLALLKIDPKKTVPWLYIGDSDALEVGDWVIAIGNQFQLGNTVTAGIVSAKSRRVPGKLSGPYDAFIQTDASINPGSSGGPLVNIKGQVVGINTAIFSPTRGEQSGAGFNIGIGFAIPMNLAQTIITQLHDKGRVVRGQLGVLIQSIDADVASALGLETQDGALVSDLVPDGPAEKAGIHRKDVIISFNGRPIVEHSELPLMVASSALGEKASVEVWRKGKRVTLEATLQESKDEAKTKEAPEQEPNRIGIVGQEVTDFVKKAFKLPAARGVLVETVVPGSAAHAAGLTPGDIIEEIANQIVNTPDQLERVAESLSKDKPVLILVRRKQGTRFVVLKVAS